MFGSPNRLILALPVLFLTVRATASAQTPGPAPAEANAGSALFRQQIQPVLEQQCVMCHDGQLRKGGLDLSNREALLRGGNSGPAIEPGNAKASLLYKLVSHEKEPEMPYKTGKLPDDVVARFADWINAGAPYGPPAAYSSAGETANAQPGANNSGKALFAAYIRPLFEKQCVGCHGAGQIKRSSFDLSTREGLLRGGENGPAVVPGDARQSALYKRVKHEIQPGMPFQEARLSGQLIARIADWIN